MTTDKLFAALHAVLSRIEAKLDSLLGAAANKAAA
jgi:hypothetical protein